MMGKALPIISGAPVVWWGIINVLLGGGGSAPKDAIFLQLQITAVGGGLSSRRREP